MSESGSGRQKRRDILLEVFNEMDESRRTLAETLVDEMLFLEKSMEECKEYAFIETNSKGEQRMTPAWKIYKDCLSQYSNNVRILLNMTGKQGEEKKDSPLRAYFRELAKSDS